MQYQYVGTDAMGRLLYEPVTQHTHSAEPHQACSCQFPQPSGDKSGAFSRFLVKNVINRHLRDEPWFKPLFIVEEGAISVSLRNLTVFFCLAISATLMAMCYTTCQEGTFNCTLNEWPMISDVIVADELYNRIFIFLTAVMMFGVQQSNLRAYYKKLYGKVSNTRNDIMFYLGVMNAIATPFVGIFDEHKYSKYHVISAGIIFTSFTFYAVLLAWALKENKDKFPAEEQSSIDRMDKGIWTLVFFAVGFAVTLNMWGSGGISALFEWATVLYFVNFFAIASFNNPFYETVHEPGKLVPKDI